MQQFKDLVTLTPWHMIFMLGNLLILTLLVKHFLFKPVQKILNERQRRADALIADAKQAKEQAEAMQAEYEKTLNAARAQAAEIKRKAGEEIEQQRKKALNEVKDEIGGMAMAIASKVVEREIQEKDHQQLIDEFIEKVGDAS